MNKAYLAEFFGTYSLSLVVLILVAGGSEFTPFAAALTLMLFVYSIGHVSGTHINPAVTVALWYVKKIHINDALSYIAAQCIGALLAMATAWVLISDLAGELKPVQALVKNTLAIGIGEALGMMLFAFGIMSVVSGKVKQELSGIVVGGSLLAGIFIAGSTSNAVLNPAVALALGSVNAMYVAGPIVGAILGAKLYLLISPEKKSKKK